jgi:hypothetical protein
METHDDPTPGDCAMHLTRLRDDFSEEMPEARVMSAPPTHKVQRNWFAALHAWLGIACRYQFLSPEVAAIMQEYRDKLSSPQHLGMRWTTEQDIREGNAMISYALWDLFRYSPEITKYAEEAVPCRV